MRELCFGYLLAVKLYFDKTNIKNAYNTLKNMYITLFKHAPNNLKLIGRTI